MSDELPIHVSGVGAVVVTLTSDAFTQRQNVIDDARMVRVVSDAFGQESAVEALRSIKALLSGVEKARVQVKAPVLALGKRIDSAASEYGVDLEREAARLTGLLTAYETEQRRIAAEAEAKRRAEEEAKLAAARKAEQERIAAEREAQRQRDEADRKARESANAEERAAARAAAEKAQAEADRIAAERQKADLAARVEAAQAMMPIAAPQRVAGQVVQDVWTFDVLDVRALAAACPDLVTITPKRADIIALIRAGTREIPGLAIRKEVKVGVRV
jgi:flagellar biosynthesis GTPase FlhF